MNRLTLILPLLLGACPDGEEDPLIEWQAATSEDPRGAFLMAWGPSADDVWVVGGQPEAGLVLRGTPDNLQEVPLPDGTPLLNWVHGLDANDVWVAGINGTLLHWNGSQWNDASIEVEGAFWGIHAKSSSEVYAVGGASAWGGEDAMAYRRMGGEWQAMDLPTELEGLGNLYKAHHDGTTLWFCGFAGAVARSGDGQTLEAVPTGTTMDIVTVHGRPGEDPIFVGGRGTGGVFELDGNGLTKTASAPGGLSGVHLMADGRAIVAGEGGYAGIYNTADDSLTDVRVPSDDVLHGAFEAGGTIWVVGGNLYTAGDAYAGSIWTGTLNDGEGS